MRFVRLACAAVLGALLVTPAAAKPAHRPAPAAATPATPQARNVIVFVADGLRYSSVTQETAPTLFALRQGGVDFSNSHAIYPTVTTANASAIATGHYLGDTGDYANTLWFDFPVTAKGGTPVTFLEDDAVLAEVKAHYPDDYMAETSLLAAARAAGMNTAVIGKLGPAGIQDVTAFDGKSTIVIDDATNRARNADGTASGGVPLPRGFGGQISQATGLDASPLSAVPNFVQQSYLTTATTEVVLPYLKDQHKPFALLYWSRDPDGTQHSQLDSDGHLLPGINGPTGHDGIRNADNALRALLHKLDDLGLRSSTDIFVTADHGFSTIAHGLPNADGSMQPSSLPSGFLAVDVARWLGQPLFDPDADMSEVDFEGSGIHPSRGSGLIGPAPDKPLAIVAANGGSDLVYTPGPDGLKTAKAVYAHLVEAPYVGALFVNDALLKADPAGFAGALPMSAVHLIGASKLPNPSIVVGFRSWVAKDCKLGEQLCAVEIADTGLHTGQGMHGSPSRADTRNFMAAIGPDFKKGYADPTPVSNADIAPTLAHILGLQIVPKGHLTGRAATEALAGGKPVPFTAGIKPADAAAANGVRTILNYQQAGGVLYFDAAGIAGRTVGLKAK